MSAPTDWADVEVTPNFRTHAGLMRWRARLAQRQADRNLPHDTPERRAQFAALAAHYLRVAEAWEAANGQHPG